jgi:lysine/ornithine N-monooxygenase
MSDYEYIIKQARKFHYTKWNDAELRECIEMLFGMTRQELISLYSSRWIAGEKLLKEEIFKILYADKIGKREVRIKEMDIDELIEEFNDKKSGNVSLVRQELKSRYKENINEDRIKIANAFNNSNKGDQQWIELQMRKELYGKTKIKTSKR